MAINGVGGYSQPYISPTNQAGTSQRVENDPNAQANEAAEQQRKDAQQFAAGGNGGNVTETRGQNLNITV